MIEVIYPKPEQVIFADKTFLMGKSSGELLYLSDGRVIHLSANGYFCFSVELNDGSTPFLIKNNLHEMLEVNIERAIPKTFNDFIETVGEDNRLIWPCFADMVELGQLVQLAILADVNATVTATVGNNTYLLSPQVFEQEEKVFGFSTPVLQPYTKNLSLFSTVVNTAALPIQQPLKVTYCIEQQNEKIEVDAQGSLTVLPVMPAVKVVTDHAVTRAHKINGSRLTPLLKGTQSQILKIEDNWVQLSNRLHWVCLDDLELLPPSLRPNKLTLVELGDIEGKWFGFELHCSVLKPYEITCESPFRLKITLFETQHYCDLIDVMNHLVLDLGVKALTLNTGANNTVEVTIELSSPLWGYKINYNAEAKKLQLRLKTFVSILQAQQGGEPFVLVLDAGHGGQELGAIAPNGQTEKHLNLLISEGVRTALRENPSLLTLHKIICTRQQDEAVSLEERVAISQTEDADLFISLHHNALPDTANPEDHQGVCNLYYTSHSLPLAKTFQDALASQTDFADYGTLFNSLFVCRQTHSVSFLLELGFLTYPEDAERCLSSAKREQLIEVLVDTIEQKVFQPLKSENLLALKG